MYKFLLKLQMLILFINEQFFNLFKISKFTYSVLSEMAFSLVSRAITVALLKSLV